MNRIRCTIALIFLLLPSLARAADDPLAKIGGLLRSGNPKEARAEIVKLRDADAAQSKGAGEAIAWLLLGMADCTLDDSAAVREDLHNAHAKFIALGDPFGAWLALLMLAQYEMSQGHYDESVAVHERIGALLQGAADPKMRLSLEAFKTLGRVSGMPVDGLGPVMDYPEIFKPILLRFAEVNSRDAYAGVLLEMGELEKAEEQLNQASAAAVMFAGMFDATIEAHKGTLRLRQWRLDEARASYTKALGGASAMPALWLGSDWVEVEIMRKLANLEVLSGRTEEGLAWNDRALERVRAASNVKREAELMEERGTLLQNAGRYDAAVAVLGDALKLATKNNDTYRAAAIHGDLGALHMFQGTYGTALEHLEKAIELFQGLNEPYGEAPMWTLLAEVHMLLESYDGAQLALDKARALAKKSGFKLAEATVDMLASAKKFISGGGTVSEMDEAFRAWFDFPETKTLMYTDGAQKVLRATLTMGNPTVTLPEGVQTPGPPIMLAISMMLKGKMLLERGDYAAARDSWNEALATNPNGDHRAGLLALIGASYWREGKNADAISYFRQAANALDATAVDVKVEELLAGYLGSNRRLYFDLLVEMLVHEGHEQEAFAHAERARARAFLQLVGNHRLSAERGADPALVREAEALRTHIAEREQAARKAKPDDAKRIAADLEREHQRYRTLTTRVKVSNPEYAALTNVEPLQIETVQKELPADVTLISYFVSPNVVHAWTIDRTTASHTVLPVDRARLQRIVCWAAQFGPHEQMRGVRRPGMTCNETATAEEAFDALIAPLLSGIQTDKLTLVPHGVLHYVPFAALRNRATGRYLIEDHTLTYTPSASALRFLRAKESPVTGGALVLGDPDSPLPTLKKLPGAKKEAVAIALRLGTTAHLGADAREALLYSAGGKPDLIHLAAHGLYDAANPLFSRIALAPSDSYDGSLTVHEILSSVDLTGVNLVVLSACRSAVGARSGGDEVVSLTRALLYAGTPGVISTLWNIDDAASAGLMDTFYRCLGDGESVADALRQAQLEVMHSEQHSDPKYWAAFTLTGDPQARWKISE
jgi:CHAT domain-containing protein